MHRARSTRQQTAKRLGRFLILAVLAMACVAGCAPGPRYVLEPSRGLEVTGSKEEVVALIAEIAPTLRPTPYIDLQHEYFVVIEASGSGITIRSGLEPVSTAVDAGLRFLTGLSQALAGERVRDIESYVPIEITFTAFDSGGTTFVGYAIRRSEERYVATIADDTARTILAEVRRRLG